MWTALNAASHCGIQASYLRAGTCVFVSAEATVLLFSPSYRRSSPGPNHNKPEQGTSKNKLWMHSKWSTEPSSILANKIKCLSETNEKTSVERQPCPWGEFTWQWFNVITCYQLIYSLHAEAPPSLPHQIFINCLIGKTNVDIARRNAEGEKKSEVSLQLRELLRRCMSFAFSLCSFHCCFSYIWHSHDVVYNGFRQLIPTAVVFLRILIFFQADRARP